MFQNLINELNRHNLAYEDISELTRIDPVCLKSYFCGLEPFPLDLAIVIRDKFFPELTYEYLFEIVN